jgi:hypothetical protein
VTEIDRSTGTSYYCAYLEHSRLLEAPEGEGLGERGIARLARRLAGSRHLRREELVREKVQRTGEHNSGVVPRLVKTKKKYELSYLCFSQCCGSGYISQRYGSGPGTDSGSFYHQAKMLRKILIPTVL